MPSIRAIVAVMLGCALLFFFLGLGFLSMLKEAGVLRNLVTSESGIMLCFGISTGFGMAVLFLLVYRWSEIFPYGIFRHRKGIKPEVS